MSYVDDVYARVCAQNADQPEFLQAVKEVLESLRPVIEKDEESRLVFEGDSAFLISRLGREVYTLSKADVDLICTTGKSKALIGNYSQVGKKLTYSAGEKSTSEPEASAAAAPPPAAAEPLLYPYEG